MKAGKYFLGALLALGLFFGGCSGGGSSSSDPVPDVSDSTLSGVGIDGYLSQATVCLDLNLDGYCQVGDEPASYTDENGKFSLTLTVAQKATYPKYADAPLIIYSGYDVDTGVDFIGKLKAPLGDGAGINISPLSTMVRSLMDGNKTKEQAEILVKSMLGLDGFNLGANPIEAAKTDPTLLKAALKLQKTVEVLAAAQKTAGSTDSANKLVDELYKKLAIQAAADKDLAAALVQMESDGDFSGDAKNSATAISGQIDLIVGTSGTTETAVIGTKIGAVKQQIVVAIENKQTVPTPDELNATVNTSFSLLHAKEILRIVKMEDVNTSNNTSTLSKDVNDVLVTDGNMTQTAFLPVTTEIKILKANKKTFLVGARFEDYRNAAALAEKARLEAEAEAAAEKAALEAKIAELQAQIAAADEATKAALEEEKAQAEADALAAAEAAKAAEEAAAAKAEAERLARLEAEAQAAVSAALLEQAELDKLIAEKAAADKAARITTIVNTVKAIDANAIAELEKASTKPAEVQANMTEIFTIANQYSAALTKANDANASANMAATAYSAALTAAADINTSKAAVLAAQVALDETSATNAQTAATTAKTTFDAQLTLAYTKANEVAAYLLEVEAIKAEEIAKAEQNIADAILASQNAASASLTAIQASATTAKASMTAANADATAAEALVISNPNAGTYATAARTAANQAVTAAGEAAGLGVSAYTLNVEAQTAGVTQARAAAIATELATAQTTAATQAQTAAVAATAAHAALISAQNATTPDTNTTDLAFTLPHAWYEFEVDEDVDGNGPGVKIYTTLFGTDLNMEEKREVYYFGTSGIVDRVSNNVEYTLKDGNWIIRDTLSASSFTLTNSDTVLNIPVHNAEVKLLSSTDIGGTTINFDGISDVTFSAGAKMNQHTYRYTTTSYNLDEVEYANNELGQMATITSLEQYIIKNDRSEIGDNWWITGDGDGGVTFAAPFSGTLVEGSNGTLSEVKKPIDTYSGQTILVGTPGTAGTWEARTLPGTSTLGIFYNITVEAYKNNSGHFVTLHKASDTNDTLIVYGGWINEASDEFQPFERPSLNAIGMADVMAVAETVTTTPSTSESCPADTYDLTGTWTTIQSNTACSTDAASTATLSYDGTKYSYVSSGTEINYFDSNSPCTVDTKSSGASSGDLSPTNKCLSQSEYERVVITPNTDDNYTLSEYGINKIVATNPLGTVSTQTRTATGAALYAGKTFYIPGMDYNDPILTKAVFNSDATSLVGDWIIGPVNHFELNVTIEGNSVNAGNLQEYLGQTTEYISMREHHQDGGTFDARWYSDEAKALQYLKDEFGYVESGTTTTLSFTTAMLADKTFYSYGYDQSGNPVENRAMFIFNSDATSVTAKSIDGMEVYATDMPISIDEEGNIVFQFSTNTNTWIIRGEDTDSYLISTEGLSNPDFYPALWSNTSLNETERTVKFTEYETKYPTTVAELSANPWYHFQLVTTYDESNNRSYEYQCGAQLTFNSDGSMVADYIDDNNTAQQVADMSYSIDGATLTYSDGNDSARVMYNAEDAIYMSNQKVLFQTKQQVEDLLAMYGVTGTQAEGCLKYYP
ncbi:hypothetical protein KKG72_05570 [bacterium]|nr:hypothetical protein [bacterium]MBU1993569.1 hypothetical protein [bacterium]